MRPRKGTDGKERTGGSKGLCARNVRRTKGNPAIIAEPHLERVRLTVSEMGGKKKEKSN